MTAFGKRLLYGLIFILGAVAFLIGTTFLPSPGPDLTENTLTGSLNEYAVEKPLTGAMAAPGPAVIEPRRTAELIPDFDSDSQAETLAAALSAVEELRLAETAARKLIDELKLQNELLRGELSRFYRQSFAASPFYGELYDPENAISREQLQIDGLRLFEEMPVDPDRFSFSELNFLVAGFARFLAKETELSARFDVTESVDLQKTILIEEKENHALFQSLLVEILGSEDAARWHH